MQLGQELKKLREEKGLMQREIGALIEVDGAMISKVENGEKPLKREHLKKLGKFFQTSAKDLEILWLADKIDRTIIGEKLGKQALKLCYDKYEKND